MKKPDRPARKKRPVYSYSFKIKLVEEIENGYLSLRYASIKYHVSRSTLDDWCERYGKHHKRMKDKNLSPEKKIKKQQQRIEDLELMLDLQREIIVDFELLTGEEKAKKFLPKPLADAVEKIKRDRLASK
jgi:transposase-like protein